MVIVNTEDTRNSAWAKDTSGFGHRMLAKMGWKEGKGLGKDEQGTSTNLRGVRRAEETLGIGAKTDTHGSDGWGTTNQNFHGVLASLRVHHADTVSKSEKKRRKKDKKDKKQKDSNTLNGGGRFNVIESLALPQNKVTAGHARKMRDAKDLSNKSQQDMAAIFGVTPQQFQFQNMSAVTVTSSSVSESNTKKKKKSKSKDATDAVMPVNDEPLKTIESDHESHVISDDEKESNSKMKKKTKKKEKKRKRENEEGEVHVVEEETKKKEKSKSKKSKKSRRDP